jgi:hypothetical protein
MAATSGSTAYAGLTPGQARLLLAGLAAALAISVGVTLSPLRAGKRGQSPFAGTAQRVLRTNGDCPLFPAEGEGDTGLYRAEIKRIHAGEGYYPAAAKELVARGYPTQSVFNWRTPLPVWALGKLPDPALGKAILILLALALVVLGFEWMSREEGEANSPHVPDGIFPSPLAARHSPLVFPLAAALLLAGTLFECTLDDQYVSPELWAGVLLGLSMVAYGLKRPYLAAALGVAALFVRELSLPYCLLAAALAWRQGRRREVLGWAAGLAAWALLFALHAMAVRNWMPAHAIAHREGWIQFGGLPFVISIMQMHVGLLLLPQWVAAIYFVAVLFGVAGWQGEMGQRLGLTVSLYVAAFSVVGHDFNQYWGELIVPLACFGAARSVAALADLLRAAARRPVGYASA